MILNVGAGGASTAEAVQYDNSLSGLEATNVQGALDEVTDSLTADNAQAFQFAYDSASGKYGYKVKEADTEVFVPFKSGNSLLLELFLANSTSGNESGSSIMINDDYFESTGTVVTCKKACKGTAYVRHVRPAITGTGSGNITVNLLQNGTKILGKTYTTIGTETISFECAVGDVLTMNGNTNHVTVGVGTVYILFMAE